MLVQSLTHKCMPGLVHHERCRINPGNRDASILDKTESVFPDGGSDSGERIVNRSAQTQLMVHATVSGHAFGQKDSREHLIGGELHARIADVGVKVRNWDTAQTIRVGDLKFCLKAEQRSGRIGRECRPALLPSRSDVAEIAVFLDAEAARLPPGERLVIPEAARVETNIAAD